MSTHEDYIWTVPDAVPAELCEKWCAFLDRYQDRADRTDYGTGENTNCVNLTLYEERQDEDALFMREYREVLDEVLARLTDLVGHVIAPAIQPLSRPALSPPELRRMIGPTRPHFDNINSCVVGTEAQPRLAGRVVTFILTLSDSDDTLVFPRQNRRIPLRKGAAVLFPPYWMYEHHTESGESGTRYSLTNWLYETVPFQSAVSFSLHERFEAGWSWHSARLFCLPESLQTLWWEEAAPELLANVADQPNLERFQNRVCDFLIKRGIKLPTESRFEISVADTAERVHAFFNLGDTAVVVDVNNKVVRLEPGDGIWSDQATLIRSTTDESGLVLLLREPELASV